MFYIRWHSADTVGHSFPKGICETTIRLRMRHGKTTFLQETLNCVGKSLKGSMQKRISLKGMQLNFDIEGSWRQILSRLF